jgi:hypothetical protein
VKLAECIVRLGRIRFAYETLGIRNEALKRKHTFGKPKRFDHTVNEEEPIESFARPFNLVHELAIVWQRATSRENLLEVSVVKHLL